MSEAATKQSQVLRGLLLPIDGGNLLLPNAAVVEVLSYPASVKPAKNKPDWYKGDFRWRNLSLPLVSWSELLGQSVMDDVSQRTRVAVCHLLMSKKKAAFVGVETSALPHLLTVEKAQLHALAESTEGESCVLGKVTTEEGVAHIPDLQALGKMIAAL